MDAKSLVAVGYNITRGTTEFSLKWPFAPDVDGEMVACDPFQLFSYIRQDELGNGE